MIIVVCTDDKALIAIATKSSQGQPMVFGNVCRAFDGKIPLLGVAEDLFIIAHGAYKGDDGNPVIGDQREAFYVNAVELSMNLKAGTIFPPNWTGSVYVDACEAANHDEDTFSFIEVLLAQLKPSFERVRVFGRNGKVGGLIPGPLADGWKRAS